MECVILSNLRLHKHFITLYIIANLLKKGYICNKDAGKTLSNKIFYKYNPETDNFERFYPSLKQRMAMVAKICFSSILLAALFIILFNYIIITPSEKNLKNENKKLKSNYGILSARLDNLSDVMDKMEERDDNFYRVMMQLDPKSDAQRYSGLDHQSRYSQLSKLNDQKLVEQLSNRMTTLEKRIYSQLQSFDQLQETLENQQDRLAHIPSVMPLNVVDYTMSSGYGWRVDPVYGTSKFHEGLDFAAAQGTDVFATGEGKVVQAGREAGYGNRIDIDHGYNYLTRYAHLSEILVRPGDEVKRGQLIGKVGSTGKSTGPHLHYEVRYKDVPQNPVNFYFMDVTPEQYYEMMQAAENAGHVMD